MELYRISSNERMDFQRFDSKFMNNGIACGVCGEVSRLAWNIKEPVQATVESEVYADCRRVV